MEEEKKWEDVRIAPMEERVEDLIKTKRLDRITCDPQSIPAKRWNAELLVGRQEGIQKLFVGRSTLKELLDACEEALVKGDKYNE